MERILIKGIYTINGEVLAEKKKFSLHIAIQDKSAVTVDVSVEEKQVESSQEVGVSSGLLKEMEADAYGSLPDKLESELSEITSDISNATRKVLYLIKYCFNQVRIDDALMSVKGVYWSKDGLHWSRIRPRLKVAVFVSATLSINDDSCIWLQDYVDSDYQPLLALRHLHRAQNESNPRYKWIEATIAAELAIKEFLIRLKPDLGTLLLEVPSPPIHKMYGVIFREYGGEALPKGISGALAKGAEIRNRLLHRPQEEVIELQKANDYVSAVATATQHLLNILYPKYHLAV